MTTDYPLTLDDTRGLLRVRHGARATIHVTDRGALGARARRALYYAVIDGRCRVPGHVYDGLQLDRNERQITRPAELDPNTREGHKAVSLAWLKKHSLGLGYFVRWWEGPTGRKGEWQGKSFPAAETSLRDVKQFAQLIAGTVTGWEVHLYLTGRTHGNLGWDHGIVWIFGRYQSETDEAKAVRARLYS